MRSVRTRTVVEIALSIALAAVLGMWKITLPWNIAGGTISLAMLPLFVVALRRGVLAGITAGALFGVIDYFIEPFFVHPAQVILDYPAAFAACGLAGLGSAAVIRAMRSNAAAAGVAAGGWMLVGGAGRFAFSFVSGIIFFGVNAPEGQPVWLYSAVYNMSYLVPSLLACALLGSVLVPALEKAVPTRT